MQNMGFCINFTKEAFLPGLRLKLRSLRFQENTLPLHHQAKDKDRLKFASYFVRITLPGDFRIHCHCVGKLHVVTLIRGHRLISYYSSALTLTCCLSAEYWVLL